MSEASELARLLLTKGASDFQLTMGVVSELEPNGRIAVFLQGSTLPFGNVRCFDHYVPEVGSPVYLLKNGPDLMALGGITTESKANLVVPVGGLIPFGGAFGNTPDNWLACDGAAVSRTDYAELFAAIGTTHGVGDGSTTFNVPDCRGRAVLGAGQGASLTDRALGVKVGNETHALSTSEIASHSHSSGSFSASTAGNHRHAPEGGGQFVRNIYPSTTSWDAYSPNLHLEMNGGGNTAYAGNHSHSVSGTSGSAGSGNAHNNMQPSIALEYIIRAR